MRHRVALLALSLAFLTFAQAYGAQPVTAQTAVEPQHLTVATKEIEPFVFVDGHVVTGFSIELWDALAQEADITYEYEIVDTVIEQLDAVESGRADVAIAAISITQAREERVDFSHRYFESGLGILTKSGSLSFADTLSAAFSLSLLRLFAFLLFSILIAGHIIWLIERKRNEAFPQSYLHGVWEGIWWAAVTVTTVGYGDKTPTGRLGRVFGILWMFAGLFIIANFTAGVTSQLTLQTLQGSINGPDDLPGKQIATVEGSTAAEWLAVQRIGHTAVETIEEAITLLDSEQVQAVVYDHPVLLYYTLQNEDKDYIVPGGSFNQEDYGIALATGSPLREEINRALLTLFENGTYNRIYNKWYGMAAN